MINPKQQDMPAKIWLLINDSDRQWATNGQRLLSCTGDAQKLNVRFTPKIEDGTEQQGAEGRQVFSLYFKILR